MEKTDAERIAELEDQVSAFGLAIMGLLENAFPEIEQKREMRRKMCNAVEAVYGAGELSHDGHLRVQRIVHEIERMFPDLPPKRA